MPTPTYTPLANITLGSAATGVTFTSISGAYRDLILVVSGTSTAGAWMYLRFNSDSGSNYRMVEMHGNGSTTGSTANTDAQIGLEWGAAYFNTTQTNVIANIMDYSATDKHKSVLIRQNNSSLGVDAYAARWANTSAITSMAVTGPGTSYAAGTSFALYGIAA